MQRNRKNKKNNNHRRKRPNQAGISSLQVPRAPRNSQVGGPVSTIQMCSFTKSFQLTTAGTSAARFLPNGLYDVDPLLASTAAIGFAEWYGFYNKYRVLSYTVIYEVLNQDVLGAEICICNTNQDPGAVSTNYSLFARNANGLHYMLGSVNSMNRRIDRRTYTVANIVGGPQQPDSLIGLTGPTGTGTNPANVIFTGIGLVATPVGALAVGITVVVTVTMRTLFFERKILTV